MLGVPEPLVDSAGWLVRRTPRCRENRATNSPKPPATTSRAVSIITVSKCDAPTAGPFSGGGTSITTREAAHICAAAPGGPRYDPIMTREERVHYDNGIWLCAAHSPLVDRDWPRYTAEEPRSIKRNAEAKAAANFEHARIKASLQPVLDGDVEWHERTANETRSGYAGLHHAVFRVGGTRKQRGRVYIDIDAGETTPRRTQACMGWEKT